MANKKRSLKLRRSTAVTLCSVCGQIACTALPLMLFFIGASVAVHRNGNGSTSFGTVCTLLLTAIFIVSFIVWLSLYLVTEAPAEKWKKSLPLLLLLALSLLLRLPQIGTIPFQDYAVYYGSLKEMCTAFQLTPAYMIDAMRLAAHPSYAYTLAAAIPEFFFPEGSSNMWLMQTVFSLLVVAAVYHLLRGTVRLDDRAVFLGALLVSCSPFFLGLDTYFQLDFGSAVFFFLFLWAFFNKKVILTVVLAGCLVLTKEFGIVLLAGFIIGGLLYYLICTKGNIGTRIMAILRDTRMIVLLIIGLAGGLIMIYYLFFSAKAWIDISAVFGTEGTTRLGYIGFDAAYTKYKLIQLFAMNFGWLLLLLIVVALVFGVIGKSKRHLPAEASLMIFGCLSAMFLYMVFSCAMVTYTVPRYNIVLQMLLALLTAIALLHNFRTKAGAILCAVVSVLLAVQSYLTIDPVMKAVYPPMQAGTLNMVYTNYKGDTFIGDYAIYNNQYSFIMKAIRSVLDEQNYDGNEDIVLVGNGNNVSFGSQDHYGWLPDKKQITFFQPDSIPLHLFATSYDNTYIDMEWANLSKAKAVFIVTPEVRTADEVFANFSADPFVTDRYTNFEPHVASGGIGGKLYYWTADRI